MLLTFFTLSATIAPVSPTLGHGLERDEKSKGSNWEHGLARGHQRGSGRARPERRAAGCRAGARRRAGQAGQGRSRFRAELRRGLRHAG